MLEHFLLHVGVSCDTLNSLDRNAVLLIEGVLVVVVSGSLLSLVKFFLSKLTAHSVELLLDGDNCTAILLSLVLDPVLSVDVVDVSCLNVLEFRSSTVIAGKSRNSVVISLESVENVHSGRNVNAVDSQSISCTAADSRSTAC